LPLPSPPLVPLLQPPPWTVAKLLLLLSAAEKASLCNDDTLWSLTSLSLPLTHAGAEAREGTARAGPARAGMIDFQDAVRAHPAWDLHSLLQDARRDVDPELETAALEHYFALRPGVDRAAFRAAYAGLAALNEARILGIFARLIVRDGKPRYAAFMPRMWAHFRRNLAAPGLEPVAAWVAAHVPAELGR
jgi:hypothetical protein